MQGVEALSFDEKVGVMIDEERCVRCGQCILHCPMGAIKRNNALSRLLDCQSCAFTQPSGAMHEHDDTFEVLRLLKDSNRYCVAEFAPAIRAS